MKINRDRFRKILIEESRRMFIESDSLRGDSEQIDDVAHVDLRDSTSASETSRKIEQIKDDVADGKEVEIDLDPLTASMMALYSRQNESGATSFVLTPQSRSSLASFSNVVSQATAGLMLVSRSGTEIRSNKDMRDGPINENSDKVILAFLAAIGALAVTAFSIFLTFLKGDNDSRRQAENQNKLLEVARQSLEHGCDVEVEVNSDAAFNVDTAIDKAEDVKSDSEGIIKQGMKGIKQALTTGSKSDTSSKSDTKNQASGKIIIRQCNKEFTQLDRRDDLGDDY
jgi:hypothetical protein